MEAEEKEVMARMKRCMKELGQTHEGNPERALELAGYIEYYARSIADALRDRMEIRR